MEDINGMIDLYESGLSGQQIAEIYGFKTSKSIYDRFKKVNFQPRTSEETVSLNKQYKENFMENIDTHWKGYFLGLLLSDGWVNKEKQSIHLDMIDKDTMSFISKCTGQNFLHYPSRGDSLYPNGKIYTSSDHYRINFNSKKLYSDLQRLGVVPNKTYNIPHINLKKEEYKYIRFILRGIIDGDGTFGFPSNSPGTAYLRIVGADENFFIIIKDFFEIIGCDRIVIRKLKQKNILYGLEICGKQNMKVIESVVYREDFGMKYKRKCLYDKKPVNQSKDYSAALLGDKEVENSIYAGNSLELIVPSED